MTTKLTETSAFEQFKPIAVNVEEWMIDRVKRAHARWTELSDGNAPKFGYRYSDRSDEARAYARCCSFIKYNSDGELDGERLAKKAKEFGEDTVLGFVAKLISKLGDIEMTNLHFMGGGDFTIHGTANGHAIRVDQQTVYKLDSRDKPYCQFPARIYVDGKFTPAAQFKDAIAA